MLQIRKVQGGFRATSVGPRTPLDLASCRWILSSAVPLELLSEDQGLRPSGSCCFEWGLLPAGHQL